MNKDHAYEHCLMLLETSIGIWESGIQSRFALAEKNYQEARKIYEKISASLQADQRTPKTANQVLMRLQSGMLFLKIMLTRFSNAVDLNSSNDNTYI
jgi:exonuclease VII small subunit